MKLVESADVIVENMRAAVKHRLKVSYDDVRKVNPRIVYGSISGFGQTGPYGKRAGVDQIVQGMGGLMSITGLPGQGPVRVGMPIADLTAGNLLALAIMMALFDRTRTGVGRWVHTSLLEAQIFMLDFQASRWLDDKEVAKQAGNDHPDRHADGRLPDERRPLQHRRGLVRACSARFCDAIGKPEWKDKPEWNTRGEAQRRPQGDQRRDQRDHAHKPAAHWVELFEEAGVPCGPINTIDQVFADPQVQHLGMAAPVKSAKPASSTSSPRRSTWRACRKKIRSADRRSRAAHRRDPAQRRLHRRRKSRSCARKA